MTTSAKNFIKHVLSMKGILRLVFLGAVYISVLAPWMYLTQSGMSKFNLSIYSVRGAVADDEKTKYGALNHGAAQAIAFINRFTSVNARILVFRQSDFAFYGERQYISFEDPKLLDLYRIDKLDDIYANIMALGITHVYIPDYAVPPLYNTGISKLLAQPNRFKLLYEAYGYKVYELEASNLFTSVLEISLSNQWFTSDLKTHLSKEWHEQIGANSYATTYQSNVSAFSENLNAKPLYLIYGAAPITVSPMHHNTDPGFIKGHNPVYVTLDGELSINGKASLQIATYDEDGVFTGFKSIWSGMANRRILSVGGAAILDEGIYAFRPVIKLEGQTRVTDINIKTSLYLYEDKSDIPRPGPAIVKGWTFSSGNPNTSWGRKFFRDVEYFGFTQSSSNGSTIVSPLTSAKAPSEIGFDAIGTGLFSVNMKFGCSKSWCYGSIPLGSFFLTGEPKHFSINTSKHQLQYADENVNKLSQEIINLINANADTDLNVRLEFSTMNDPGFRKTQYRFSDVYVRNITIN